MSDLTDAPGLHHVTGIAGDPQSNVDLYAGALGLRFCKRTVNFEDILGYHLYYGDSEATPGTVVTFFPSVEADPGRVGPPQPSAIAFAVPEGSLEYWADRLESHGIDVESSTPTTRFDERVLAFTDPDGTPVELVAGTNVTAVGAEPWTESVSESVAIRAIAGVTLDSVNPYATAATLETLGFDRVGQDGGRVRYRAGGDRATVVDVLDRKTGGREGSRVGGTSAEFGREGAGTIHHVAVRVPSVEELYDWHDLFRDRGDDVSRVKDRHFFHSLYVRDPGGILFELATETPGLAATGELSGDPLYLPPRFEDDRELIESQLPSIRSPEKDGRSRVDD